MQRRLFLLLGLAFVLACRLLLYVLMPERSSDFDPLYKAATRLLEGQNPYPFPTGGPYPLPAVLLAVPFTAIPLALARPAFDILVGWAFAYALGAIGARTRCWRCCREPTSSPWRMGKPPR